MAIVFHSAGVCEAKIKTTAKKERIISTHARTQITAHKNKLNCWFPPKNNNCECPSSHSILAP